VEKTSKYACVAVNKASQAKIKRYEVLAKEWNALSLPLAFETHGAFGPHISTLGKLFAAHIYKERLSHLYDYGDPYRYFMQALSAALCTANAAIVHGTALLMTNEAFLDARSKQ